METLESNNNRLLDSIGKTQEAMSRSLEYIGHTEQVVGSITEVATLISEKNRDMDAAFDECRKCLIDVDKTIDSSQSYFEDVSRNLDKMERTITKKSLIFEDMTNILEQYPGMIESIIRK